MIYLIEQSQERGRPNRLKERVPGTVSSEQVTTNGRINLGREGYGPELWTPYDLVVVKRGRGPIENWDYFGFGSTGAFSQRAIRVLKHCFGDRFEPLPMLVNGIEYFALHCRQTIDCLDHEASEIDYSSTGRVLAIDDLHVRPGTVSDPCIFSIPELRVFLYATDSVPEIADEGGLKGFNFHLVGGERPEPGGSYLYQNTYFRFQIEFPDTWKVTTWRKGNLPKGEHGFQLADDDLRGDHDKYLFIATLFRPRGEVQVDASIELSLWPGRDLKAVAVENLRRQKAEIDQSGTWECGNRTFEYHQTGLSRFFYAKADNNLWFYGVIAVGNTKFFKEAIEIMESLSPL